MHAAILQLDDRAVEVSPGRWEMELSGEAEARALLAGLGRLGPVPVRFERVEPTLHEIFVAKVGAPAAPAGTEEVIHA